MKLAETQERSMLTTARRSYNRGTLESTTYILGARCYFTATDFRLLRPLATDPTASPLVDTPVK